jgi:hypothetical protein
MSSLCSNGLVPESKYIKHFKYNSVLKAELTYVGIIAGGMCEELPCVIVANQLLPSAANNSAAYSKYLRNKIYSWRQ